MGIEKKKSKTLDDDESQKKKKEKPVEKKEDKVEKKEEKLSVEDDAEKENSKKMVLNPLFKLLKESKKEAVEVKDENPTAEVKKEKLVETLFDLITSKDDAPKTKEVPEIKKEEIVPEPMTDDDKWLNNLEDALDYECGGSDHGEDGGNDGPLSPLPPSSPTPLTQEEKVKTAPQTPVTIKEEKPNQLPTPVPKKKT